MDELILLKGQIVKIGGLPYEILEDARVTGPPIEDAQNDREGRTEAATSD